jgi:biopolymer transport protein ExbB/TolQ
MDMTFIIEIGQLFESTAQSGIYIISSNLLYPVIIILIGLIVWSVIELGGFLSEWHSRHRDLWLIENGALNAGEQVRSNDYIGAMDTLRKFSSNRFLYDFINSLSRIEYDFNNTRLMQIRIEKLLQEYDTKIRKKLEKSRFVAKAAPMFGLMGTLIPMGPALLGLAQGDIQTLSDNLIIAFGTTVIGLMSGIMGYLISTVRSRWYTIDMSDMEYISEILFSDSLEYSGDIEPVVHKHIEPDIKRHIDMTLEKKGPNVVKVISRYVYFDLFFTTTGIIIARTAGSILGNPLVYIIICGLLNVVVIAANIVGYTVVPLYLYLVFINILMVMIFMVIGYITKERAAKKSHALSMLSTDDIMKSDPHNTKVNYVDIQEINITRSVIKILTNNGWIKVGRMSSYDYMGIIQTSPISVTIGDEK